MKKLLCILMLGLMFGQDVITTKEITVSINENTEMIDINDYVDLTSGYYSVELVYIDLSESTEPFDYFTFYCGVHNSFSFAIAGDNSQLYYGTDDCTIDNENSTLISDGPSGNPTINGELILRISGRFDDVNIVLQGDMNSDGNLNILDVVSLVQEILNGDMIEVNNLLNILKT